MFLVYNDYISRRDSAGLYPPGMKLFVRKRGRRFCGEGYGVESITASNPAGGYVRYEI